MKQNKAGGRRKARARLGSVIQLLIAVVFCASHATAETAPARACAEPKARPAEWVARNVDALVLAAGAAFESEDALKSYEKVLGDVDGTLRRCGLARDKQFAVRYREFVEYVLAASKVLRPDHKLGFDAPDAQYFAETRAYVSIPGFLTSQSFLHLVSRHETLDRAKAFLRLVNANRGPSDQLIFFSYRSRHLGTPDKTASYERLLVVVPGDASKGVPEKWVQFGVTDPGGGERVRNISVVSARVGAGGASEVYFKDYYRTYRRDGSVTIKGRWELGRGDDSCVRCHKSGVLPIFPEERSVSEDERQALLAANRRFRTYGPPGFGKYLDARKFGPGLGSGSGEDRARRFGEAFLGTKVERAMSCASCHRQGGLGALNWPMDRTVINSFIRGGRMPLGHELEETARDELYEKLVREYFATDDSNPGVLKSWLLGRLR